MRGSVYGLGWHSLFAYLHDTYKYNLESKLEIKAYTNRARGISRPNTPNYGIICGGCCSWVHYAN